nr:hypothetical protein [Vibrio cidicii]
MKLVCGKLAYAALTP